MKENVVLILFFLNFAVCQLAIAQSGSIDSLKLQMKDASDAERIDILLEIQSLYLFLDYQKSLDSSKDAVKLSKSINDLDRLRKSYSAQARSHNLLKHYDSSRIIHKELERLYKLPELANKKGYLYNVYGDFYYRIKEHEKATFLYLKAIDQFLIHSDDKGAGNTYSNLGNIYHKRALYDSSIYYYKKAREVYHNVGTIYEMAYNYYRVGSIHLIQGQYDHSLNEYFKAIEYFEKKNSMGMISICYKEVANIYAAQKLDEKAIFYYHKSLELLEKTTPNLQASFLYTNIAAIHEKFDSLESSKRMHLKALDIRKEFNDMEGIGYSNLYLGTVNLKLNEIDAAEKNFLDAIRIMRELGNKQAVSSGLLRLATLYHQNKNHKSAIRLAQESEQIAMELIAKPRLKNIYQLLSNSLKAMGKYEDGYGYLEKYQIIDDSLTNTAKNMAIAEITSKYETAKKDQELAIQKLKLGEQQSSIESQKLWIIILAITFGAFFLISYLLFNRFKLRQKNKDLAVENEQIKLYQSLYVREETDKIINYFASSLYGKNTVDQILQDVVDNCIQQFQFQDCVIYLADSKQQLLIQKVAYQDESDTIFRPEDQIAIGKGIVGTVALSGIPLIIHDVQNDERYKSLDSNVNSQISVPMMQNEKVIGVIDSRHSKSDFFNDFHLQSIKTIASICASKISQIEADRRTEKAEHLQLEAKQIKALDQLKSEFFANISHEFRTPLNLILNPLKKGWNNVSGSEALMMERNAEKLLLMVNQLLDLAKLEVGRMGVNLVDICLRDYLQLACSPFESLATSKAIDFQLNIPDTDLCISMDTEKLDKVINNLIANAIKFTPIKGEISVAFCFKNNYLTMKVKDNGIGIPENAIKHVFDRFYQVDATDTRHYEGAGIGLSLCKELVELLGGQISCTSLQEIGSEFCFTIPYALAKNNVLTSPFNFPKSTSYLTDEISEHITNDPEQNQVLIVEDHKDLREYIASNLNTIFNIVTANNGQSGLEKAEELVPDLIVTDVMMPEMNGIQFIKKLKKSPITSHIPIIMLTARDDSSVKNEGFLNGADQYLTKPFETAELQSRITGLIGQRNKLREKYQSELVLKPTNLIVAKKEADFLTNIVNLIGENISNQDFTVEKLQTSLGMSRMQLHRKLKALTNQSTSEFIRGIRLERAKLLFEMNHHTHISEIAYQVGFNNLSYFAKCFKEKYGSSPKSFLKLITENNINH